MIDTTPCKTIFGCLPGGNVGQRVTARPVESAVVLVQITDAALFGLHLIQKKLALQTKQKIPQQLKVRPIGSLSTPQKFSCFVERSGHGELTVHCSLMPALGHNEVVSRKVSCRSARNDDTTSDRPCHPTTGASRSIHRAHHRQWRCWKQHTATLCCAVSMNKPAKKNNNETDDIPAHSQLPKSIGLHSFDKRRNAAPRWAAEEIETSVDSDRTKKRRNPTEIRTSRRKSNQRKALNIFSKKKKKEINSISQTTLMEMNAQF